MSDTLLELDVSELNGGKSSVSRTVIVSHSITFFNLHRTLQFCIKPRQSDATVDGKAYSFEVAGTGKAIKSKSAQMHKNSSNGTGEAQVGDAYIYTADNKTLYIEVDDKSMGDSRYRVPRCIKGSNGPADADLRAINGKLVFRKFTKTGAGQRKSTQPRIFGAGASNADVVETELNMMEEPLRGFPWMPRLF